MVVFRLSRAVYAERFQRVDRQIEIVACRQKRRFRAVAELCQLAVYVGVGVLIGVFGGVNAIRNYLKV